jgi:hypothetical protein
VRSSVDAGTLAWGGAQADTFAVISANTHPAAYYALGGILVLYAVLTGVGIRWGLPSRQHDAYLFGESEAWSGQTIAALSGRDVRTAPTTGADVDVDPLPAGTGPRVLNANVHDQGEIYARYRLYTHQPDEMITMMALSGLNPRAGRLDPKLYQYGGLFLYPVGALLGTGQLLGLLDVRSDLTYYLENPGKFAAFYIVARGYAGAWGLLGVVLVFAIGRRLAGATAGLWAALIFALLPVVTALGHEAKPHLPGAVLMLAAGWAALRALDLQRPRDWALLHVTCGAAVGMVVSAAPIVVLIPLALGIRAHRLRVRDERGRGGCARPVAPYGRMAVQATIGGLLLAAATYFLTNPYVLINLFVNRPVLASNFGNSLAMYEVGRLGEGFVRVADLTLAGATPPVVLGGLLALVGVARRRLGHDLMLLVPAGMLLVQFVLLGAGKPDEYGRFGIFYEAALAIGCGAVLAAVTRSQRALGIVAGAGVAAICAWVSAGYFWSFHVDSTGQGSRALAAAELAKLPGGVPIAVVAEPAPYACPPVDFGRRPVVLYREGPESTPRDGIAAWAADAEDPPPVLVAALDDPAGASAVALPPGSEVVAYQSRLALLPRSRLSWANKPIVVLRRGGGQ